jgi:hypothetical protein
MRSIARSVVLTVIVALVGASSVFGVQTSAGVSESYNISASITVGNVPSTGVFAAPPACYPSVAGCLASDYSYLFVSTIASNNGTGFAVDVTATALTSGANTIPVSARGVSYGHGAAFTRNPAATNTNIGALSPSTAFRLGTTSAPGSVAVTIEPLLRLDPNAFPAGTYVSSFTVAASTNP